MLPPSPFMRFDNLVNFSFFGLSMVTAEADPLGCFAESASADRREKTFCDFE